MTFVELLLTAVALSMDAFAVSTCKGLSMRTLNKKHALIIGLFFGGFQALMPLIGWLLGTQFERLITNIDHWIVFALLALIGGKMIFDSLKGGEEEDCGCEDKLDIKDSSGCRLQQHRRARGRHFVAFPSANLPSSPASAGPPACSRLAVWIANSWFKYQNKATLRANRSGADWPAIRGAPCVFGELGCDSSASNVSRRFFCFGLDRQVGKAYNIHGMKSRISFTSIRGRCNLDDQKENHLFGTVPRCEKGQIVFQKAPGAFSGFSGDRSVVLGDEATGIALMRTLRS